MATKKTKEPALDQEVQEAIHETVKDAVADVVEQAVQQVKDVVIHKVEKVVEEAKQKADSDAEMDDSDYVFQDEAPEARPHAFIIMPFGTKFGGDGKKYNFNEIYRQLIKPALEEAGFEPFRADEATTSGDILTDMFQELLLADLCLVDMSIDNANVFYELGVRHAFQRRGVVHISSGRAYMPFDVFNVRTLPYGTTDDGVPDPETLDKDRQAIARMVRDTYNSDRDAIHSPIFNLLTGLAEPDRKTLRTPLATGFWREYNEWKQRVAIARRQKRIGDILLLTEEISNPLIKEEAIGEAGAALRGMGRHELALQQYRDGLDLNPKNQEFRRQEAFHLNRLGKVDEAIVKLEGYLEEQPWDTDAIGILGRIYKDMWQDSWKSMIDPERKLREAFESYHWLTKAYHTYRNGYRYNLNDTYPGTNAHTMGVMLEHLSSKFEDMEDPDPDIVEVLTELQELRSTLIFALEDKAQDEKTDYWTLVSLAELRLFTADRPVKVTRAYRKALIAARKNIFFLQSSLGQLELIKSLGMREDYVDAGISVIEDEIRRIRKDPTVDDSGSDDDGPTTEEQAILFAGHNLDTPFRKTRRFPEDMQDEVRAHIAGVLDKLEADGNDTAFTSGAAAGSTIIFIEEALARGMQIEVHLPFVEPKYIKEFVSPGGDSWVDRYYALRNNSQVSLRLQADHIGPTAEDINPYERNNRWTMYSSLLLGIDKVRLVALWDGQAGNSQDLDGQLVSNQVGQMRQIGGRVEHINTTKFEYWLDQRPAKPGTLKPEMKKPPKTKAAAKK